MSGEFLDPTAVTPFHLLRGVLDAQWVDSLFRRARDLQIEADAVVTARGTEGAVDALALQGLHYVPASSSFSLPSLMEPTSLLRGLPRCIFDEVERRLGPAALVEGISWVRLQHAPRSRPAHASPHAWHQDGACGHDFVEGDPGQGLVPLATVWIPLTPCGHRAPGLELVEGPVGGLCTLEELQDPLPERARYAPRMGPGDALVLDGAVVHRTFVDPEMTASRHSIGLRFVSEADPPARFTHSPRIAVSAR